MRCTLRSPVIALAHVPSVPARRAQASLAICLSRHRPISHSSKQAFQLTSSTMAGGDKASGNKLPATRTELLNPVSTPLPKVQPLGHANVWGPKREEHIVVVLGVSQFLYGDLRSPSKADVSLRAPCRLGLDLVWQSPKCLLSKVTSQPSCPATRTSLMATRKR